MTQEHTITETTEYESADGTTETVTHTVTETGAPESAPVTVEETPPETPVVVVVPQDDNNALAELETTVSELRAEIALLRSSVESHTHETPATTENASTETEVTPPPPSPERVPQKRHLWHRLPAFI